MNDNHIEIKERRGSLIAKGVIYLFLTVFSLTIALLPYIFSEFQDNSLIFSLSGGIAFCSFATLFVFLLFKECKPDSIMVLNSHGFTDRKNIGANIEIEWTNVSSVKLMGKKEMPYLGITLENADLVMAHMKKPYVEEMCQNIEEGLPHILLSQREIRYPISELKDLFVKFTREARALKNDVPLKPKNNPFTTEDVLRAFGKLEPKENEENSVDESIIEDTAEISSESSNAVNEVVQKETARVKEEHMSETQSIDSFYEALLRQSETATASEPVIENIPEEHIAPVSVEAEANENNGLPDEFMELMTKAKSSKIAEIEKMLNDSDVPFSVARSEEKVAPIESEKDSTSVQNIQKTEDDAKTDETSANTLKQQSMSDTKEFYPEIIHFDDI